MVGGAAIMEIQRYEKLDCVIRYPKEFSTDKRYPIVFYMHGAGGRGHDISLIWNHPFFRLTEEVQNNAVFIAPQCYANSWFDIFEQLQDFVHHIMDKTYVDKKRIYLMGASMGGYTTWQLAMTQPEWFAAIVPICGGGMYWNAGRLINMGVWAFHGKDDGTVFCEESEKMVQRINAEGGNAKFTIYEGCGHDAWTPTMKNREVWEWLFAQNNHYVEQKSRYDDVEQWG